MITQVAASEIERDKVTGERVARILREYIGLLQVERISFSGMHVTVLYDERIAMLTMLADRFHNFRSELPL